MLSGNINIEDDDWDSVRQGYAALTRDLERMYLSFGLGGNDFGGGVPKSANDQTVQQDGNYGYQAVTTDMLDDLAVRLEREIADAIAGIVLNPSVGGDLSGTCSNASVIKLRGVSISTTAPSIDGQVLMYNLPATKWEPVQLIASNGGLLTKDGTGLIEIAGGTALSVVGNSTNTTGSVNAIASSADNTVLGRRSGVLTWAKVARSELADGSACSIIGRAANSSGAVADITASADGQVLQRLSGTVQFAAFSSLPANPTGAGNVLTNDGSSSTWSKTPTLGNTTNAGSLTISNPTSATAIVISPTLVSTAGKVMSVREIDVCDAGVAKKMLVLASAPY